MPAGPQELPVIPRLLLTLVGAPLVGHGTQRFHARQPYLQGPDGAPLPKGSLCPWSPFSHTCGRPDILGHCLPGAALSQRLTADGQIPAPSPTGRIKLSCRSSPVSRAPNKTESPPWMLHDPPCRLPSLFWLPVSAAWVHLQTNCFPSNPCPGTCFWGTQTKTPPS